MGGELLDAIVSWKTFVVSLLVFGLYPGAVLRLIVLAYPRDDPRRRELLAELYGVPRLERPYWVMEQLEVALFEGLGERIRRRIKKLRQPEGVTRFRPEALVNRTGLGIAVRSKSEVIVADVLTSLGISYEYERPLHSPSDPNNFRLPDFTVTFEGDEYYWEHLGMLDLPVYAAQWERKRLWYEKNGYSQRLITSADHPGGGIDATELEGIARARILQAS
jgi:hypothetical protein